MAGMSDEKTVRPEWVPEDADPRVFTTNVMRGVVGGHDGLPGSGVGGQRAVAPKRRTLSVAEYEDGVLSGNRTLLARAITLIESNAPAHFDMAQELLVRLLPHSGKAVRVGITGVPGVGKSTFIEAFGMHLCRTGHKIAVLAIDPSSAITGGSVLGDKTRMELLSREQNAFIRPSPSGGALGGVARKTRETMLLCEAAGCDTVLIETVGVGQTEVVVRSMTDFFLLLLLATQGDELQGIKKGVMEISDAIFVNKADGDNVRRALAKKAELKGVLSFLAHATQGWDTVVGTCSALTGEGVADVWATIEQFMAFVKKTGALAARRKSQSVEWMHTLIREHLIESFYRDPRVRPAVEAAERDVLALKTTPAAAAADILRLSRP